VCSDQTCVTHPAALVSRGFFCARTLRFASPALQLNAQGFPTLMLLNAALWLAMLCVFLSALTHVVHAFNRLLKAMIVTRALMRKHFRETTKRRRPKA
jgi:hypothetical protein